MEKQELFCHACNKYVRFDVPETDGRLIVKCPNCGHEHYRIVMNGIITEERWGSANRNMPTMYAVGTSSATTSFISYYSTSAGTSSFTAQSWLDSTAT
jgi:phage FluMu protein Com